MVGSQVKSFKNRLIRFLPTPTNAHLPVWTWITFDLVRIWGAAQVPCEVGGSLLQQWSLSLELYSLVMNSSSSSIKKSLIGPHLFGKHLHWNGKGSKPLYKRLISSLSTSRPHEIVQLSAQRKLSYLMFSSTIRMSILPKSELLLEIYIAPNSTW